MMTTISSLTSMGIVEAPNYGTNTATGAKGPLEDDPIHGFFRMDFFNGLALDEALVWTALWMNSIGGLKPTKSKRVT